MANKTDSIDSTADWNKYMVSKDNMINAVISMCKMWGFNYMPIDGGHVDFDALPFGTRRMFHFRFNNTFKLLLQHNKLGHQDLTFYTDEQSNNIVAVKATNVTPTLLNSCAKLGQLFYGFKYKEIKEVPDEPDSRYFMF